MTLLSICQDIANDIGLPVPTSIIGNTDETASRLLACAQRAGRWLAKKPQGGWVDSIREYTFTTTAIAVQSGSIANSGAGGVAVISGLSTTTGITANRWYASGYGVPANAIITAVTVSTVTLSLPATSLGAGTFTFGQSDYALPSDYKLLIDNTLWDRSRYWQMRGPMSPQQWQLYKSSVIGKATIQRRWRIRSVSGTKYFSIDPVPFDNAAQLVFEYVSSSWCQSSLAVAQSRWAADTDTGILDEELIYLATFWRMLRRLGEAYDEELSECESEVAKAMAHDGGMAILNLVPTAGLTLIGPWNVPESNFGV